MVDVSETLKERGAQYGRSYEDDATFAMSLLEKFQCGPSYYGMSFPQKHALMMIAVKLSRLLNGNPNHKDGWHDIAGYATLAERSIDG